MLPARLVFQGLAVLAGIVGVVILCGYSALSDVVLVGA